MRRRKRTLLSILITCTCAAVFTSNLALAQAPFADDPSAAPGAAGDDYFSASLNPAVLAYLTAIENRHASERVWKLYRAGSYNEPLEDSKYTLARFPNHPRALHLLGEIAKATNNTSMPIPYFEGALRLFPQHAYTHAQYGHYLVEIGAVNAGMAELMEALRLDPNQLQAQAWLAEARPAETEKQKAPQDGAKGNHAGPGADRPDGSQGN